MSRFIAEDRLISINEGQARKPAQAMAKILRGSLRTLPTTTQHSYSAPFSLSCQKVIYNYCDTWASSNGMRSFLASNAFNLAKQYPSVEFVVHKRSNKHPNIKGCFGQSSLLICLSSSICTQATEGIKSSACATWHQARFEKSCHWYWIQAVGKSGRWIVTLLKAPMRALEGYGVLFMSLEHVGLVCT